MLFPKSAPEHCDSAGLFQVRLRDLKSWQLYFRQITVSKFPSWFSFWTSSERELLMTLGRGVFADWMPFCHPANSVKGLFSVWRWKGSRVLWWVRLFVSIDLHFSKTAQLTFTNFLCMLPVAVALSSFGSVAISYVLLVLWILSLTMSP